MRQNAATPFNAIKYRLISIFDEEYSRSMPTITIKKNQKKK